MGASERTFIAVKPDGVQRGLTGEIIKRFEARGFKLVAMKMMQASKEHLENHYSDLAGKPFFNGLVKYMGSSPLVAMCWEGSNVVLTARKMMGETSPLTPSLVPSGETTALKSAETSFMAQTLWNLPTRRLPSGSNPKNSVTTTSLLPHGSMNKYIVLIDKFLCHWF